MKNKKRIIVLASLTVLVALAFICTMIFDENDKTKEEITEESEEPSLKLGSYYNPQQTGEVTILSNGTAYYVPDFNGDECYAGEYVFEENILVINVGSAYWKFEVKGDELTFIEYKYAGTVTNTRGEKKTYSYEDEELNVLKQLTYTAENEMYIAVGESGMSLWSNPAINTPIVSGEIIVEGNIITVGSGKNQAMLELKDGKLYLLNYWSGARYMEFAENEMVFDIEYKTDAKLSENPAYNPPDSISTGIKEEMLDVLLPGYGSYYNEDKTAELIIYEDGNARYCPDINSSVNYYGKCTFDSYNRLLIIKEIDTKIKEIDNTYEEYVNVTSVHKFKYDGEKLVLKEYIDSANVVHTYEDEHTFSYMPDEIINVVRTGMYSNGEGLTIVLDGKGNISLSLSWGIQNSMDSFYPFDYMFGNYEINGDEISVIGDGNNKAKLRMENGKLIIESYYFNGITEAEEKGSLTFEYIYDGTY